MAYTLDDRISDLDDACDEAGHPENEEGYCPCGVREHGEIQPPRIYVSVLPERLIDDPSYVTERERESNNGA